MDKQGLPLAESITAANTHDSREALPLVDDIAPPFKGPGDDLANARSNCTPTRDTTTGECGKGCDSATSSRGLRGEE